MKRANINLMTSDQIREYHKCPHCNKTFKAKSHLAMHFCEQKRRSLEQNEFVVKKAYTLFKKWIASRRMAKIHASKDRFIKSRYYKSFIKFTKWSRDVSLVEPMAYVKYMADNNILPNLWVNENMYEMYLENFDNIHSGEKQAFNTIKIINRLKDAMGCDASEVFDYIETKDLVKLIRTRNLSPWVLLSSASFYKHLSRCPTNRRIVIEGTINPKMWKEKIEESPEMMAEIKKVVSNLQL